MHSLTSAGRPYWTLFQARSRTLLQYRAAALAAVGTRVFWGVIRLMIYGGFYASTTSVQPLSEEQVAGYVWLGQAMLVMTLTWLDPEIRDMIRSGNVAYELVRPIELYWYWFARSVAARLVPTVVQGAPILLLVGPLLGLRPPPSLEAGALWVVSTVLALLLSSAIGTLMSVSLVWTISGEGVARLMPAFAYAFSGMAVPLLLWPAWAQVGIGLLPFVGLVDTPFRIYLGQMTGTALWLGLLHQTAWTLILVRIGLWTLRISLCRVVVQGG